MYRYIYFPSGGVCRRRAGASKVLISAPAKAADRTVVYGVNHDSLTADAQIVSNASCTTNCLAPLVAPLHAAVGIEQGLMTTIHAFTNDQNLSDRLSQRFIPSTVSDAKHDSNSDRCCSAIGLGAVVAGRLDGLAVRVPTINVSLVDLTFTASRDTSVEEVNGILRRPLGATLSVYCRAMSNP